MNELYQTMLTIRLLEERLQRLCDEGKAGDLHFNKGQEAIAVGVCTALWLTDRIVTHHRTIAHQIAQGAKLVPLIAELLGKGNGVNGGRAGEMHISDPGIGHDFSFQLVGTCVPVAAGIAWALKNHHKTDAIVAVFFGDAATANGQWHEGVNIAAVNKLPLLLVCENNGRAGNIDFGYYGRRRSMRKRVRGYEINGETIDGNDVALVLERAKYAAQWVRDQGEPYLLECMTERLCWHKQGQRDIRSAAELEKLAERDPLKLAREKLEPGVDERLRAEINQELDDAFTEVLGG